MKTEDLVENIFKESNGMLKEYEEEKIKEKEEEIMRKKVKFEGFVNYPVNLWDMFIEESKKHFLKRYYGKNLMKCDFQKSDFKTLYTVSVGKFSKVILTKWKQCKFVIVKIREKKAIVQNHLVAQTKREIRLLNFVKFPFVMNACVVQCNVYLYYVMSFACGNSLKHLTKTRILSEKEAKFYCSQVALTLEFLHSIGVIHRGIDASNVLICHDGYVKLTGFSKSKIGLGKYKSVTDFENLYSIPDILNEKHGHLYDLWCFGVLIYFLCSSENPFKDLNGKTTMDNKEIKLPEYFSPNLKDITSRLLDYNQCHRLGAKCPAEIRQHDWFDIPWNDIENKRVKPPFLPQCSYPVKHFDTFPTIPLEESTFDPYDLIFKDCFSNHYKS